ncbi:unnamed protein product [Leptidea sinapis]|uniref:Protein kinase domain-containing protein n=1 Tax=Leptidea sinapis TaxID=189913 RepID=A0A5E4QH86_9NEOP|nr:unnamed protein product [Leptidea sinapis]
MTSSMLRLLILDLQRCLKMERNCLVECSRQTPYHSIQTDITIMWHPGIPGTGDAEGEHIGRLPSLLAPEADEDPKDLIRRFLVVDPMERIKISDALGHPFFHTKLWDQDVTPLKKSLSTTSRRMSRIDQIALRFQRARQVTTRPDNRPRRSAVIDGCAFRVYGHWVKKGEGQNRAALFENTPKTELKSLYVSNLMERIYQESNS